MSAPRIMVPSGFINSHKTADGFRPAIVARSTEPSVWPLRANTPPGVARSGNTWPGCTRSDGLASAAIAARIVVTRSAAETPVDTPCAASIDWVNAVA